MSDSKGSPENKSLGGEEYRLSGSAEKHLGSAIWTNRLKSFP
jgi:hypothetical protein